MDWNRPFGKDILDIQHFLSFTLDFGRFGKFPENPGLDKKYRTSGIFAALRQENAERPVFLVVFGRFCKLPENPGLDKKYWTSGIFAALWHKNTGRPAFYQLSAKNTGHPVFFPGFWHQKNGQKIAFLANLAIFQLNFA